MKSLAVSTVSRIKRREQSSRRIRRIRAPGKPPLTTAMFQPQVRFATKIFNQGGTSFLDPRQSKEMARAISRFTSLSGCLDQVEAFLTPGLPLSGGPLFSAGLI